MNIIEDIYSIIEILKKNVKVHSITINKAIINKHHIELILQIAKQKNIPIIYSAKCKTIELSLPQYQYKDIDTLYNNIKHNNNIILVCDHIVDPHNLGSIIRSAIAFNIKDIVIPKQNAANISTGTWKSSVGSVIYANIYICNNIYNLLYALKKDQNNQIIALDQNGTTDLHNLTNKIVDFNNNIIIIIGNEHKGISKHVLKLSDISVSIKINSIDSLNASVAASIFFWQLSHNKELNINK